jgi:hypothetical protein
LKTIILGISGRKQAGKTATYDFIRRSAEAYKIGMTTARDFSFAGPLKKMCVEILGLTHDQAYGTDEQKNTPVEHLLWENFPVEECRRVFRPGTKYVDRLKTGPMTAREVMQYWGTNVFRAAYEEVWTSASIREIKEWFDRCSGACMPIAVLPDVRFPNEVRAIRDAGGYVLRLTRNVFGDDAHDSETKLDADRYDWSNFDLVYDNSAQTVDQQMEGLKPWLQKIGVIA